MSTAGQAIAFDSDWLTIDETRQALGKSVSTIERLVATKAIASKLQPRAGRKPMRLYSATDVKNLTASAKLNTSRALVTPALPRPAGPLELSLDPATISALGAVMTEWRNGGKLWLSFREARRLSGLTQRLLRQACLDGKLEYLRDGRRWRVRRASLEAFAG